MNKHPKLNLEEQSIFTQSNVIKSSLSYENELNVILSASKNRNETLTNFKSDYPKTVKDFNQNRQTRRDVIKMLCKYDTLKL